MTVGETIRCVRRSTTTWSRHCQCPDCRASLRRMSKRARNGAYKRIPAEQGWDTFTALLEAGWSPAAVASAANLNASRMHGAAAVWRAGGRMAFGAVTCERLASLGTPERGFVPVLVPCRQVRALARVGWSLASVADVAGVAQSTVSRVRAHGMECVLAPVAAGIDWAFTELGGRVGSSTRSVVEASRLGWAPPYVWGDIRDPACVAPGFPRADEVTRRG